LLKEGKTSKNDQSEDEEEVWVEIVLDKRFKFRVKEDLTES
jgi:hypothetical protein